ncbi:acylphosphatase family protein [Talaromyces stipitatus ATCC 10500]|uniref:Acylphosphatase n=1 Tax=Talaromyces stipitatus (strain ATCC 10500 / CBS 375.48 / QM 6759 / NRRL 1006) TaxID=441959 RepID=B8LT10_TALSN|nr:acylphosphatase family protein [Talaromyces stipitatus ATCC 10500]EED23518.1 acylphosphatase family protein [Talaromyces stipitatus ATCC 10500]
MALTRVRFKVHGTVQGVSFRAFTQKRAIEYGVTGWVQNSRDGRVEGEIQGEPELVQKLLKDVDKGPRHAQVVKLEKTDIETQEDEISFEIRR